MKHRNPSSSFYPNLIKGTMFENSGWTTSTYIHLKCLNYSNIAMRSAQQTMFAKLSITRKPIFTLKSFNIAWNTMTNRKSFTASNYEITAIHDWFGYAKKIFWCLDVDYWQTALLLNVYTKTFYWTKYFQNNFRRRHTAKEKKSLFGIVALHEPFRSAKDKSLQLSVKSRTYKAARPRDLEPDKMVRVSTNPSEAPLVVVVSETMTNFLCKSTQQ